MSEPNVLTLIGVQGESRDDVLLIRFDGTDFIGVLGTSPTVVRTLWPELYAVNGSRPLFTLLGVTKTFRPAFSLHFLEARPESKLLLLEATPSLNLKDKAKSILFK